MPRVSEAEKRKSHKKIVDAAGELFRQNGIEATSVAAVMQAAGMTHGGFYRHFDDKEALVAAAFEHAVNGAVAGMVGARDEEARAAARAAYLEAYLSDAHVRELGRGCPMAALGSELSRGAGGAGASAATAVRRVGALLSEEGGAGEEGNGSGYARLALLIGAVTLARLGRDEALGAEILDAARGALARI